MIASAKGIAEKLSLLAEGKNYVACFNCVKKNVRMTISNKTYVIPFDKIGLTEIITPDLFDYFIISKAYSTHLELYKNEKLLMQIDNIQ